MPGRDARRLIILRIMKTTPRLPTLPTLPLVLTLLVASGLLLLCASVAAQDWTGRGRVWGSVLDDSEQPVEGARVTLSPIDRLDDGPGEATTNRKGRWIVGGLAQGRWRLMISAEGFVRSEGWVTVGPEVGPSIRVVLRPLSEVGPALAEELPVDERPTFRIRRRLDETIPADEPRAGRTGSYRVAFTEPSPFSSLDVFYEHHQLKRSEIKAMATTPVAYDLAAESFEVYVPEAYSDDEEPYGLFVWVSPTAQGKVRRQDKLEVLAAKRLLWVGANNAGNPRPRWDRIGLALDAAHAMQQLYNIDERRIYVGGYSGGGRISTSLSVLYPEVFQGGFLFMGCNYYKDVSIPDKPGAFWPAAFRQPPKSVMRIIQARNRYVFMTGERDFNRPQTRDFHRRYKKDGFQHVTYVEIPGADHYFGVRAEWLAKGIEALDEGL
jgi:dienelactone hydrolase